MVSSPAARAKSPATAALLLLLSASLSTCAPSQVEPEQASTESVAPVVTRAERAMERGDYDTAIAGYAEALERTPWNTRLSTALVSAYAARAAHPAQSGRPGLQAAEADLRTALSIAPDDPSVRRSLAAVLLDLSSHEEDPERSLALRMEARRHAPKLEANTPVVQLALERRLDLAFDLVERGQLDAAIDRLEQLHGEYPESANVGDTAPSRGEGVCSRRFASGRARCSSVFRITGVPARTLTGPWRCMISSGPAMAAAVTQPSSEPHTGTESSPG